MPAESNIFGDWREWIAIYGLTPNRTPFPCQTSLYSKPVHTHHSSYAEREADVDSRVCQAMDEGVEVLGTTKDLALGDAGEEYSCGSATAIGSKGKGEDRHFVTSFSK